MLLPYPGWRFRFEQRNRNLHANWRPVQESVGRRLRYPGMPLPWYVDRNCFDILPELEPCLFKSPWPFFTDWTD